MLVCPKCQKLLKKVNNSYLCSNNHCYDISKDGYVNLLLANQKHSTQPGDDIESLRKAIIFTCENKPYSSEQCCSKASSFDKNQKYQEHA